MKKLEVCGSGHCQGCSGITVKWYQEVTEIKPKVISVAVQGCGSSHKWGPAGAGRYFWAHTRHVLMCVCVFKCMCVFVYTV